MMHPEGYRKALRLARQAAKFGFPIVTLVDTPGAYPGAAAEEGGVASATGSAIMEWFQVPVPVVSAVIGEGGSGGALGIAVADLLERRYERVRYIDSLVAADPDFGPKVGAPAAGTVAS